MNKAMEKKAGLIDDDVWSVVSAALTPLLIKNSKHSTSTISKGNFNTLILHP